MERDNACGSRAGALAVSLVLCPAFLLPGCASLRAGPHLYSEANHELARKASESFAAVGLSKALEGEYALLLEMADAEQAVVRRHTIALRNANLIAILASQDVKDSWETFETRLVKRGNALVGEEDWQLGQAPTDAVKNLLAAHAQLPRRRATLDQYLHSYDAIRDPGTDPAAKCPEPANAKKPSEEARAARALYGLVAGACEDYFEARRIVEQFGGGLIGRLNKDLAALATFQQQIATELQTARGAYSTAKEKFDELSEQVGKSQADSVAADLTQKLEKMEKLQATLGKVSKIPGLSGLADDLKLEGLLEKLSIQQENVAKLIDAFRGSGGGQPAASSADDTLRIKLAAKAGSALDTFGKAGLLGGTRFPPLSPLLLESERLRLRVDALSKRLARAKRRVELLREKRGALGRELLQLARADDAIWELDPKSREMTVFHYFSAKSTPPKDKENLAWALLSHANAWTLGRIPAEVIDYQLIALSHDGAVDASANALAQWENLVGVPLSQLLAWHAAGIKVEDIARLLSAAGLAAVAVGVN